MKAPRFNLRYHEQQLDKRYFADRRVRIAIFNGKKKYHKQLAENKNLQTFTVPVDYNVFLTHSPREVDHWLSTFVIGKESVIGLDTESDVVCLDGRGRGECKISIIQIATKDRCLIYKTANGRNKPPEKLVEILKDKSIIKSWIGFSNDIKYLNYWCEDYGISFLPREFSRSYSQQYPDRDATVTYSKVLKSIGHVDLQRLVQKLPNFPSECRARGEKPSAILICKLLFGKFLCKDPAVTMSRWSRMWLSRRQIMYASVDAYLAVNGYLCLQNKT